jgi:hypothetical protein
MIDHIQLPAAMIHPGSVTMHACTGRACDFVFFLLINYHHVDFILNVGCVGIDLQWPYIASCFLDLLWTCWAWSQGYDNTSEDRENCLCRQVGGGCHSEFWFLKWSVATMVGMNGVDGKYIQKRCQDATSPCCFQDDGGSTSKRIYTPFSFHSKMAW